MGFHAFKADLAYEKNNEKLIIVGHCGSQTTYLTLSSIAELEIVPNKLASTSHPEHQLVVASCTRVDNQENGELLADCKLRWWRSSQISTSQTMLVIRCHASATFTDATSQ